MADDGSSHYSDEFYTVRRMLQNNDVADNARGNSPVGDERLHLIQEYVSLVPPTMGDRDIHSGAERRAWAAFRIYGPKALAGDKDALDGTVVNGTTEAVEPRIVAVMRDRMALLQEMTVGLNEYTDDEQEVFQRLRERGIIPPLGNEDWDEFDGE